MKKIPTIFKRDPENRGRVLNEPNPDCEWVFAGEGITTRKYDGTCCRVEDGELWKRREIKKGKSTPEDFVLADYDEITGKTVGWVPVNEDDKADKHHIEAFGNHSGCNLADGTYELCGPKIQGGTEGYSIHVLINHNSIPALDEILLRDFYSLCYYLENIDIEGIVFHHPDGRMGKIKKRDFGFKR